MWTSIQKLHIQSFNWKQLILFRKDWRSSNPNCHELSIRQPYNQIIIGQVINLKVDIRYILGRNITVGYERFHLEYARTQVVRVRVNVLCYWLKGQAGPCRNSLAGAEKLKPVGVLDLIFLLCFFPLHSACFFFWSSRYTFAS